MVEDLKPIYWLSNDLLIMLDRVLGKNHPFAKQDDLEVQYSGGDLYIYAHNRRNGQQHPFGRISVDVRTMKRYVIVNPAEYEHVMGCLGLMMPREVWKQTVWHALVAFQANMPVPIEFEKTHRLADEYRPEWEEVRKAEQRIVRAQPF